MAINLNGTGSITGLSSISSPTISGGSFPAGTAAAPGITLSGDSDTGLYSPGANQIAITTSGTAAITVDASQRVGVGTATPSSTFGGVDISSGGLSLVVGADSGATTRTDSTTKLGRIAAYHYTNSEEPVGGLIISNDSSENLVSVGGGSSAVNAATVVRFFTAANTTTTSGTERARIDSSGRLLVGTSSARSNVAGFAAPVQIEGTSAATSSLFITRNENVNGASANIFLAKSRSGSVGGNTVVQDADTIGLLGFAGNDGSNFVTAAAITAQVDGTPGANDMPGRLVFSTTADGASSPTERMRITNTGGFQTFCASTSDCLVPASAASAGTARYLIYGSHSATGVNTGTLSFAVYTNGNVVNTNNSYGAISDIKLKENIVDASSQWDDIKALQVRKYNFKEGQTHTQIGLVAQEVELVSPGLVSESPDRDAEGNDLGTVTKSVNYSVLYMKAVKALQEAMERIETLEAKVAALESA